MPDKSTERASLTNNAGLERDRRLLTAAREKGRLATLGAFLRLSGPGWLQSAITLGGGSLAGSLYLGVLAGFSLLWLQPLAMILGIVMLSAISYVTLSTGERPFRAINHHVNPVLGWGWAIATLLANLVWALPQFALATAATRQNLLPGLVGAGAMPEAVGKLVVCGTICLICIVVVWFYDTGSRGIKLFEAILKIMVGVVVVCFFGVVIRLSFAKEGLHWGAVLRGLVPDLGLLTSPAKTFAPFIAEVDARFRQFWIDTIVGQQRDVMVTAVSAAVGINMTFLLPYSMLRRRWDRSFRGLAIFDLATGLFVPFMLATGCVVIASAAQFHTRPVPGVVADSHLIVVATQPPKNLVAGYRKLATVRLKYELGAEAFANLSEQEKAERIDALPAADKKMAAMLVNRDAFNLAQSLSPLTGDIFAHYVFGIGVIGMGVSSIIVLMLINGFVVCEMIGIEPKGRAHRLAALMPCIGVLGPFIWTGGKAQFWLAIPTSMFAMVLLPIAYLTFYLLMNQKSLLAGNMPRGGKRAAWNTLMAVAAGLAAFGSIWSLWSKLRWLGISLFVGFVVLALIVHFVRCARRQT
ncbi:MAG TPA: divalent metal cation transporter [Sedimentisphaerales bacterium]|nr:divalent metal cation transporter [Sedimentisphaerales bacterium]